MFLSTPTVEELKQSELTDLMEMLVKQTTEYHNTFRKEGISLGTLAIRELINNIHAAIESKKAFYNIPD